MKEASIFLLCVPASGLLWAAENGRLKAPSDVLTPGYHTAMGMDFVLQQIDDLRCVYCDAETIADRKKRAVCFLDAMYGEWRKEVLAPTNARLSIVFQSIGFTNWHRGPQIRIIEKNTIIQSNSFYLIGSSAWRGFLEVRIDPADIVVLCPRQG